MGLASLLTRTCTIGMLIPSLLFSSSCSDSSPTEPPKKEQPAPKPVNNCPVFISSSSSKSIDENRYFSEQIQARDSDGDPIYYSLPVNPGWLSVSNTGLVSGLAPEVIQDQTQQYEVMITDGKPGCSAKQQNTVTVKNVRNNYVVSNNLLNSLQNVNDNNLVFSSSQNFSVGDVLVSGVNNKAPFGFLREITSRSSDGKTFGTEQGSLEQILINTSLSFSQTLSPSSISHSSELEGVTLSPMESSGFKWGVNLNNVILYDRDGNPNTAYDQIIANGKILFNLKSEFDAKFGFNKLEKLTFKTSIGKESDITIGSNLYGFAQMRTISLMENYMTPITIVVAGFPVVIVPKLSFNVGLNPTQSNLLSLRVKQNSDLDVGFKYENGIEEIGVFATNFDFSVGSFREDAGISVFAGPRLDLLLYGVGGPTASLNSNLKMEFEKEKWKLYGGLRALAGASMEIFGKGISAFARQVIEYEKLIAESSTQPPTGLEGKIAFVRVTGNNADIYSINPDGSNLKNLTNTSSLWETHPSCSPDGSIIAYSSKVPFSGDIDTLYFMNSDGSNKISLNRQGSNPVFSLEGDKIAYLNAVNLGQTIYVMEINKSNPSVIMATSGKYNWDLSWSPGSKILFSSDKEGNKRDIYSINSDGKMLVKLTDSDFYDRSPSWSPDRSRIAFESNRSGIRDIYVMNADGSNLKNISNNPNAYDRQPSWSPNGQKIVYTSYSKDYNFESSDIWIMNADGSNKKSITGTLTNQGTAIWCK